MIRIRVWHVVAIASLLLSTRAYAADGQSVVFSPLQTFGKLTVALAAVLCCFWFFSLIIKQLRGGTAKTSDKLKIVTALPIGQRERLLVVQVADQQLLVGATAENITKLHVLESPIVPKGLSDSEKSSDFRSMLKLALNKQVPR